MALDLKNLTIRSISGIVYIGLIIGAVMWGMEAVAALCSIFIVIGIYEQEKNSIASYYAGWKKYWIVDTLIALMILWTMELSFSSIQSFDTEWYLLTLWLLLIFTLVRIIIQIFADDKEGFRSIAISAFSVIYLAIPLSFFLVLELNIYLHWMLVAMISMIWINDTGAYLVGSLFGRHKMFPKVSPKKSWEGLVGGWFFNLLAGVAFFFIFKGNTICNDIIGWMIIGSAVTVMATLGDLFESMIKRSLNIKDSGNVIPGHGGVLDRIDSLLFVLPTLMLLLVYLMQSVSDSMIID